jgi:PKD repeat protein
MCHVAFGNHVAQHDMGPASTSGASFVALHESAAKPIYCFACHGSTPPAVQLAIDNGMAGTSLACTSCHAMASGGTIVGVAPTVNAGPAQTVLVGSTVAFSGAASKAGTSPISSYGWAFGDGTTGTGVTVSHVYRAAGTFTVRLTVKDAAGLVGTATTTVTVQSWTSTTAPSETPVAVASAPMTVWSTQEATLSAQGSAAPDGRYLVYFGWDFGDGTTSSGYQVRHRYAATGTYSVTLTVRDNMGVTATARTTVTVVSSLANQPPVPAMTVPLTASVNEAVTFDGSASRDPDGTIARWVWSFGDRSNGWGDSESYPQYAFGSKVTHAYTYAGTFSVKLTVYDDKGASASKNATITVQQGPP